MDDPRLGLSGLTATGDGAVVVGGLDSVRIVVSAAPERMQTREDQAALYNLVSAAAGLFPHLELRLPGGVATDLAPFASGDLYDELQALQGDLAQPATTEPTREFHLAWARDPEAAGLAGDAAGWSYSVGPRHLAFPRDDGPALGSLAATSFMVAQAFGHALAGQLPFHPTEGFVTNLLDYQNAIAPEVEAGAGRILGQLGLLGCGSVGSSVLYAALLATITGGPAALVDPDRFRDRNKLRYPVLREVVAAAKVTWLTELARTGGIGATPHETDVKGFLAEHEDPPALPLALVSVDTVEGRRDATDLLARTTLNAGVAGMQLHVARHGFGEEGCANCQYVDVAPTLSGAQALAERVGLSVERVIAIHECEGGYVSTVDAEQMARSGRFQGLPPEPGERLADLDRRIYAQARVETGQGDVLVSTPFVSAMAGLLLLAEALKESDPRLHAYRLRGRYDLDMSGEPPGFAGATPRDPTGRCLCHSRFRRNAYRQLHGLE